MRMPFGRRRGRLISDIPTPPPSGKFELNVFAAAPVWVKADKGFVLAFEQGFDRVHGVRRQDRPPIGKAEPGLSPAGGFRRVGEVEAEHGVGALPTPVQAGVRHPFQPLVAAQEALVGEGLARAEDALAALEPHGYGNPGPLFAARGLTLSSEPRILKEKHLKLALRQDGRWNRVCELSRHLHAVERRGGGRVNVEVSVQSAPRVADDRAPVLAKPTRGFDGRGLVFAERIGQLPGVKRTRGRQRSPLGGRGR